LGFKEIGGVDSDRTRSAGQGFASRVDLCDEVALTLQGLDLATGDVGLVDGGLAERFLVAGGLAFWGLL
jgi:hypothetical protein